METIKFIDEIIESNDKEFELQCKIGLHNVRVNCYNYMNIFECFDKIVNLFNNYDPNVECGFTAFFNCYKYRNNFHDPLIIFPLKENKMEKYVKDIIRCHFHHLLVVEWENYLKSKEIKELPFKILNLGFSKEMTVKEVMDPDDVALIFNVDRFYKDH